MNRAKEHRTRPKSPCSDGLFVARRAAGALRLIPPSFSRRAPADDQTQRSLRAASPLHAARSSLSPLFSFPRPNKAADAPVRSSSALPLRIHAERSRFAHRQGQGAVALPHGRARLTSAPPPHRIRILLAVLFPSSHCPSSFPPLFPFSPRQPRFQGTKKKHVKRRAFLFLRSDAALERTGRSSPKKHGRFRQQRQPESGGSRRLRHDAPIKSRTSAAAKAAEPALAPFPAGSGTLICLQSDTTADRMTRSLRMTRTSGSCRLQKSRIAGTTS